jgi:hypothetical protein
MVEAPPDDPEAEPKLYAAWLMMQSAELMYQHLRSVGVAFPDAGIYCHQCIASLRSVTFLLQKALKHEPGFDDWYGPVQKKLRDDAEFKFLDDARDHVLHRGALKLMFNHAFEYSGGLHMEVRGIGPEGPDIWVGDPEGELVPADWRKLDGFKFETNLRFAHVPGLPEPPEKEVKLLLGQKMGRLRGILLDAEERFDPNSFDWAGDVAGNVRLAPRLRAGVGSPGTVFRTRRAHDC